MQHSEIEWIVNPDGSQGYSMNPVKGLCPMACSYCYAAAMYKRFKWDTTIRFHASELEDLSKLSKPSTIFVGSTIELFGDWVRINWLWAIFQWVRLYPQHTFIFLSHRPDYLVKFRAFPVNCWIGVTVTDQASFEKAIFCLSRLTATVKFISFEPLLSPIHIHLPMDLKNVNWITIGAMTGSKAVIDSEAAKYPDLIPVAHPKSKLFWTLQPPGQWINYIREAAKVMGVKIFLKDNLKPFYEGEIIQELPCGTCRQKIEKKGVQSDTRKQKRTKSKKGSKVKGRSSSAKK